MITQKIDANLYGGSAVLATANFFYVLGDSARTIHKVWPGRASEAHVFDTPADAKAFMWHIAAESTTYAETEKPEPSRRLTKFQQAVVDNGLSNEDTLRLAYSIAENFFELLSSASLFLPTGYRSDADKMARCVYRDLEKLRIDEKPLWNDRGYTIRRDTLPVH